MMLRAARILSASGGARLLCRAAHSEAAVHRVRSPSVPTHSFSVGGFTVTAPHARTTTQSAADYMLSHPIYTKEEVEALKTDVHFSPAGPGDRLAQLAITAVRATFDLLTGYKAAPASNTVSSYLTRIIFLETVAGVPGMVSAARFVCVCFSCSRAHCSFLHCFVLPSPPLPAGGVHGAAL